MRDNTIEEYANNLDKLSLSKDTIDEAIEYWLGQRNRFMDALMEISRDEKPVDKDKLLEVMNEARWALFSVRALRAQRKKRYPTTCVCTCGKCKSTDTEQTDDDA